MGNILLAQVLCPKRHCILAFASQADADALAKEADERISSLLLKKVIQDWCGICGAKASTWTIEVGDTGLTDVEEFTKLFLEESIKQIETRKAMDSVGGTFDTAKNN